MPFDGVATADSRADNQLSEGDAGQWADGADLLCAVSGLPQWAGGAAWLECEAEKEASVLFWLLYTVVFLLMFYSVAQAQMRGYILNIKAGTVKRCRCCGWCL